MEFELIKSSRGGELLLLDAYVFTLNRRGKDGAIYWRCREAKKSGCRANAVTRNGELHLKTGNHSCGEQVGTVRQLHVTNLMKQGVLDTPTSAISQVYENIRREELSKARNEAEQEIAAAYLPSYGGIKSSLYRKRQQLLPKEPSERNNLVLPEPFTVTLDGRPFLLANNGNENKIIIFGTVNCIELLCRAPVVYMDGTFQICPKIFDQLYTLHGYYQGEMFPFVYALLPNRRIETYNRLFQLIKEAAIRNNLEFNPDIFQIDFEQAVIQSIMTEFSSRIRGCAFHFAQAIWRKVQKEGMVTLFKENKDFERLVRRLVGLPLVPREELDDLYCIIKDIAENKFSNTEHSGKVVKLLEYFEDTWLNERSRFARTIWNHFDNTGSRTINNLEGWHNRINAICGKVHPNVFKFVEFLQMEQARVEADIITLRTTRVPKVMKKKYRKLEEEIARRKVQYDSGDISILEYLDAIKYFFHISD